MLRGFAVEGREMSIQCSFSKLVVKMARFVAVLAVLVIVSLANISAQSIAFGRCPKYQPMKTLDVKKFGGQWYEVERSFYLMEMFSTCTSLLFSPKPSGPIKVTIKTIGRLTGSPGVSLGTAVPVKNGSAFLDYRVDTRFPSAVARIMPGSGRYLILDTDYENYAILWSCSNMGIMYSDQIWVLGRNRELPVTARAMVYDKLTELKIDSDRLTLTRHRDCAEF